MKGCGKNECERRGTSSLSCNLTAQAQAWASTYIDFCILEAFLEIVVDRVVGNRREERHVGDTGPLLGEAILPVGLRMAKFKGRGR